jgi:hypothetical protein
VSAGDLYRRWIEERWAEPGDLDARAAELFTEDFVDLMRQLGA